MRGKLEANFSYLRPYSRVIVLNMAATQNSGQRSNQENSFVTEGNARKNFFSNPRYNLFRRASKNKAGRDGKQVIYILKLRNLVPYSPLPGFFSQKMLLPRYISFRVVHVVKSKYK